MKGRTLRLYLVDGSPNGVLWAEIINWTGKVILTPRTRLADLAKREEAKRTGVYCLVGPDPDQPGRDRVYIGEGDNVLKRLMSHDKDEKKDFWIRAAIVISKDNNITKAHGRYLESRLIKMASEAERVALENGTAPDPPVLPEPDIADMEYFLEQVQVVLPALGMNFLQPKPTYHLAGGAPEENVSPRFILKSVGAEAYTVEIDGEFVVLKGSTAKKEGTDSWTSYRALRDRLVVEGKLVPSDSPEYYAFAEDVAFSSLSAAATVVRAHSTNGPKTWRLESDPNTNYADWRNAKIEAELGDDPEDDEE